MATSITFAVVANICEYHTADLNFSNLSVGI